MPPNLPQTSETAKPEGRLRRLLGAVCRGFGGRALVVGLVLKALGALVRLAVGAEPALVGLADSVGSLALIAGVVCVLVRLVPRARRRLLWRVRDKMILSYVFIGVVRFS